VRLETKTPLLQIKIYSHPNIKPCAWNFLNPILRTKNHLHPNKKPCAWKIKNPCLESKIAYTQIKNLVPE
jgi:hypothetical protein